MLVRRPPPSQRASSAIDQTEVLLTLETRDPEHRDRVVPFLESRGYQVHVSS